MSPSCGTSQKADSPTSTAQHTQETDSNSNMRKAQTGSCCNDSVCECDDYCLDQLARAICADDVDHMHTHPEDTASVTVIANDDNVTAVLDSSSIANSDDACGCEDDETEADMSSVNASSTPPKPHSKNNCVSRKRADRVLQQGAKKSTLPTVACEEHRTLALSRQRETLANFGCICRAMLARGLQSCCSTRLKKSLSASLAGHRGPAVSASRVKVSHHSIREKCSMDSLCSDSCCANSVRSLGTRASINVETRTIQQVSVVSLPVGSCCKDSCCGDSIVVEDGKEKGDLGVLEGAVFSDEASLNRVVLSVKGMTCIGCENKLIRTLRALPTISHIETSLVLSRAEFNFSGDSESLESLIQVIQKRSGFAIEQVADTYVRSLELQLGSSNTAKCCAFPPPIGVLQVSAVKKVVRIIYDPRTIGAREILSYYEPFTPSLAPEPQDPAISAGIKHIRILGLRTIISACLTIPVLVMAWAPLPHHPTAYAIASLILASIVQFAIAGPFYFSAFKSLFFSGIVETDLLIVLSTTTAYIYSVVAFAFGIRGRPLSTGQFFETSTLLVTLIMVGQLISAFARHRAVQAISLRSLQQTLAILILSDGSEESIDTRLLQYGDIFKVAPDSSIITDGVVFTGHSEVDESMMTGEPLPVEKSVGSTVLAGTANGPGTLHVQVTRLPGENTISDIANMVDKAQSKRARVQETVDIVCGWFVPIVLTLAIITFVIWLIVGKRVRHQHTGEAVITALTYAIAVLAISCPCAIGLAVPVVILVAGTAAVKHGLIFKSAVTIESARKVNHVVFDKTGTLTQGKLTVVGSHVSQSEEFDVQEVVRGLVANSQHPVARAVDLHLGSYGVSAGFAVEKVEMVTGKGMQGDLRGEVIQGGSATWLGLEDDPIVRPFLESGLTTFCVTHKSLLLAVFALSDTIRPEVVSVLSHLRSRGIKISILSGDHLAAVERVALELDIPIDRVRAGCLPADKQDYIHQLSKQGDKVLFCGDGTNDAVALAQAHIGVHMAEGSGGSGGGIAASTAASVVLIHPSLVGILTLIELSEAVNRRILLNFIWSVVYNLVAILFAAGAFVNARIAPAYAGLGEMVSVVPVVLVAMQLKWFKTKH